MAVSILYSIVCHLFRFDVRTTGYSLSLFRDNVAELLMSG